MNWASNNLNRRSALVALTALSAPAVSSVADELSASKAGDQFDLPALIRRARSSVLLVGTFGETDSPRFMFRGTGFVAARGNLVITNSHVLPEAGALAGGRRLVVQSATGSSGRWVLREVEVLKLDRERDLVLLKVLGDALLPLPLAGEQVAQEGKAIAILGFPVGGALGFSLVTHRGIISSIAPIALPQSAAHALNEKSIRKLREGSFNILQLDATAYPGNSGGPVLDLETGAVVGVLNMVLIKGSRESALTHPTGISYAIPVDLVAKLLARPD
ncbi:S1 family peptidase [Roseateles sp. PN1]|uniref:S1 family peptidase n=1 Tax=Roseateles sp. PN1 TaxID=3137372 RepID=UPI003139DD4E